jgi:hypothetical protein
MDDYELRKFRKAVEILKESCPEAEFGPPSLGLIGAKLGDPTEKVHRLALVAALECIFDRLGQLKCFDG